jgi:hypothetical protein
VAPLLSSLATTVARTGALQRASEISSRSVRILEAVGENGDLPDALVTHSRILFERGDYRGAADALRRALSIQLVTLGPAHPAVGAAEVAYAEVQARLGDPVSAFDGAIRGDAVVRTHMRTTVGYLPERQALRLRGDPAARPRPRVVAGLHPGTESHRVRRAHSRAVRHPRRGGLEAPHHS